MYGFIVPDTGLSLLAQANAGAQLILTRVEVGKGVATGEASQLRALVSPVATATSSTPQVTAQVMQLMVEYRNDLNGGLTQGFWLSEFGLFAKVAGGAEALLYYASLAEHPQWVNPLGEGLDVRRFPVTVVTSRAVNVTLSYPSLSFVTSAELALAVDGGLFPNEAQTLAEHTSSPYVHANLLVDGGGEVLPVDAPDALLQHAMDEHAHPNILLDGDEI